MLIKTYRFRLLFFYLVPFVAMIGLALRLYYLQVVNQDFYQDFAQKQHFGKHTIGPTRGKILDANGHELVGTVIQYSVFVDSGHLAKTSDEDIREFANKLSTILIDYGGDFDRVFAGLMKRKGSTRLARGLDEQKRLEVTALAKEYTEKYNVQPSTIRFEAENRRQFSRPTLAPHIVGFTKVSDDGLGSFGVEGVEHTYDNDLRGSASQYIARHNVGRLPLEPAVQDLLESTYGHSVKLTIDETLQAVTQNVLQQGVTKTKAAGGVAICYHVKTGEVLAMANYPSFALDNITGDGSDPRKNRALVDAIEPGSVMKILTFASLFDARKLEPTDMIHCEYGNWTVPGIGRPIKDTSKLDGLVTVSRAFQKSSNVATVKAARAFDRVEFYRYLSENFGFGRRTGIDLPGEGKGVLNHYDKWSQMSMSSLPMGYEIQVTAIQMVAAVGALANKGAYMQPHVVKEILDYDGNTIEKFEPQYVRQVADPVACAKILDMMEQVVEKGTATSAKIDGYRVGGKTGTTKKTVNGHYVNDYISSFCGVAPIEDPEVCIYVYVDSPKGSYYGGVVAAPIFREIAREAMKVLRIPENRKTMPEKEFQVALDKVRNRIEGRAPKELISIARADENEPIADDVVPDLQGLTMAEAVRRAASVGMEVYTTEGSGIVYEQEPKANEIREGAKGISVKMANSADYVAMLARKYNDLYGQESEERVAAAEEVTGGDLLSTESMSLTLGGRALPLAMADNPAISLVPAGTRETPAVPAAAPDELFPDLDPYANTPVDVGANKKSWANFEKEMKEMEDRAKERGDADTAAEQDADTQPVALILDVPVFDGSEDYDPSTTQLKPVEILAPSAEEIREGTTPKPLQSLYDL